MARGRRDIEVSKAGYRDAKGRGDMEEQARWANQVGHAYKERGQYVQALKWFRIDHHISSQRMPHAATLMPTCQSMGETYLRLQDFTQALIFQEKHYQLAEAANDLVEQQRASTQLGRTNLEIYEQEDNFSALQKAKEYLTISMDLAVVLKENPPSRDSPSFVKELIDAYNNMGLLRMVTDDPRQALKLLQQALEICNEEELREDDDARSRIHHNLGRLYCEQREWGKAREHTQLDISICQKIPHPQGEAKGYINLGEIHFKSQMYDNARSCFERALQIAQSLEDEDLLVSTAKKNLEVIDMAEKQLEKLVVGEQKLKKLQRMKVDKNAWRRYLNQEYKLLQELIGQAEELQAWEKHLQLAKRLKEIVKELGDMEKLGDALEIIGESYYNLRMFEKAKKCHLKSWEVCKRIGHLEGQSVAKINYGNALDCTGDWEDALEAYKDAYQVASSKGKAKMLVQQISALENMHYCYFVRLERFDESKDLEAKLESLKELGESEGHQFHIEDEHCSETLSIGSQSSEGIVVESQRYRNQCLTGSNECHDELDFIDDNLPLSTFKQSKRQSVYKSNKAEKRKKEDLRKDAGNARNSLQKKLRKEDKISGFQFKPLGKRPHVVFSDDECVEGPVEIKGNSVKVLQQEDMRAHTNIHLRIEPSLCLPAAICPEIPTTISVLLAGETIMVKLKNPGEGDAHLKTIDNLREEIVRCYKNSNPTGKKPLIQHLILKGRILQSLELVEDVLRNVNEDDNLEAVVAGWMPLPLVERYIIFCEIYNQSPNAVLVEQLTSSKAAVENVVASGCNLDDVSFLPLVAAVREIKNFSHLDLSHNSLGNSSIEKIQEIIAISNQMDLGLTLDLHSNNFGAASLAHICDCPATLSRLEVLNLSDNHLSDASARYLVAILKKCEALEILKLEACDLTTRTISKISSALQTNSPLVKLSIGKNNPISSLALAGLFMKLSNLECFMELDLTGIYLDKHGVDGICHLLRSSKSISTLMLGGTGIQSDGANILRSTVAKRPEMLVKLDISFCTITSDVGDKLCADIRSFECLSYLNLSGNKLSYKGIIELTSALSSPGCRLKTLVLNRCLSDLSEILVLFKALQGNGTLRYLFLSENNLSECVQLDSTNCDHSTDVAAMAGATITSKMKLAPETPNHPKEITSEKDMNGIVRSYSTCAVSSRSEYASAETEGNNEMERFEIGSHVSENYDVADSEECQAEECCQKDEICVSSSRNTENHNSIVNMSVMEYVRKNNTGSSTMTCRESYMDEVAAALCQAQCLVLLDLSDNGFKDDCIDRLFAAWSDPARRAHLPQKHCDGSLLHFNVGNELCCGRRPCCDLNSC